MANIGIGANAILRAAFESSWGVTPSPTTAKKMPFISEALAGTQQLFDNPVLIADPNPADGTIGKQDAGGSFSTVPTADTAPWLAKLALGSLNTTGAGPYVHTAKLVSGSLPSASIEVLADLDTDQYKIAKGCTSNTFKFDVAVDGFLRFDYDVKASSVSWAGSPVLASGDVDWTTDQRYFDNMQLQAADLKEGGVATAKIVTFSCTVNQNLYLDDYRVAQGGLRNSLVRQKAKVSGSARVAFEDLTMLNKAINGTFTSFDFTWTYESGYTLQIVIPRVRLERNDPKIDNPGPLFVDFNWVASKDSIEGTSVKIVVVNDVAGSTYNV